MIHIIKPIPGNTFTVVDKCKYTNLFVNSTGFISYSNSIFKNMFRENTDYIERTTNTPLTVILTRKGLKGKKRIEKISMYIPTISLNSIPFNTNLTLYKNNTNITTKPLYSTIVKEEPHIFLSWFLSKILFLYRCANYVNYILDKDTRQLFDTITYLCTLYNKEEQINLQDVDVLNMYNKILLEYVKISPVIKEYNNVILKYNIKCFKLLNNEILSKKENKALTYNLERYNKIGINNIKFI